ncbi:hypothetical protein [Azospirillum sp. sgz302134]
MPHDFRPQGLHATEPGRAPSQPIGFHELRQACEISTLREELERIVQETEALRDHIEEAVEQVRNRFAALTPEDLADSDRMAPLLQFAVSSLLEIRDGARRLNTQTGAMADDDRPSWMGAAEAPRTRPAATSPAPSPLPPAAPPAMPDVPPAAPLLSPLSPMTPAVYAAPPPSPRPTPASAPAQAQAEPAPPSASWLTAPGNAARKPAPRSTTPSGSNGSVDWLSRPER